jgi:hypothetical protein
VSSADGVVLGARQIVNNGPAEIRWNLVLLGDGYRQAELGNFALHAQEFSDKLFATAPFDALRTAINVFRVDVASTDSGADDPVGCGGPGTFARTYFDASFCHDGVERLLEIDDGAVLQVASTQVPQWAMVLVIVNSATYGGSGGQVAVFSRGTQANEIALHEMGHTAFGLADEYGYWAGCGVDTDRDHHPLLEPAQANVTIATDRAVLKWRELLTTDTLPTTRNANCSECDPQSSPVAAATVGAFEGAHYYHCGAFRAEFTCRMRELGQPFCSVCRRRIHDILAPHLPVQEPEQPQHPQPAEDKRPATGCLLAVPAALALGLKWTVRRAGRLSQLPHTSGR